MTPGMLMNNVRLIQGQTKVLELTVKDCNGRPANLGGATVYFTVRLEPSSEVLINLVSPDGGIKITDASKGAAKITINSDDSNIATGKYRYEVWIEYDGTPPIRYPVVKGAELCVESTVISFDAE